MPKNSTYKRIEGSGGDGGVEAYWTEPNGRKIGYQAKYFLRPWRINWNQIDRSVKRALTIHPELKRYVIALPRKFTGKSREGQRSNGEWGQWIDRVNKWKECAHKMGIKDIEFEPWTEDELLARLIPDRNSGLRKYFFDDIVLDKVWFRKKLKGAIVALGERFQPEDHVDVRIQKLFSVISRSKVFLDEFSALFAALRKCGPPRFKKM